MSGRSGYRKTDRKRSRFAQPKPPPSDYILRFTLPRQLAAFLSPGQHGRGVAIGFNNIFFATGQNPAHCCQLTADFLDKIGARQHPQVIAAQIVKLLPCSGHCPIVLRSGFNQIGSYVDLEAIHDRASRFADRARPCAIDIRPNAIAFGCGEGWRGVVHDFADGSDRKRA
jgi:hypothetical protein